MFRWPLRLRSISTTQQGHHHCDRWMWRRHRSVGVWRQSQRDWSSTHWPMAWRNWTRRGFELRFEHRNLTDCKWLKFRVSLNMRKPHWVIGLRSHSRPSPTSHICSESGWEWELARPRTNFDLSVLFGKSQADVTQIVQRASFCSNDVQLTKSAKGSFVAFFLNMLMSGQTLIKDEIVKFEVRPGATNLTAQSRSNKGGANSRPHTDVLLLWQTFHCGRNITNLEFLSIHCKVPMRRSMATRISAYQRTFQWFSLKFTVKFVCQQL